MDMSIIDAALEGLRLVFSWPYVIYPLVATLVAMVFSATPGLNNAALMALVIPMTYGWGPLPVMLVFGALVGGATFMGSATAILFNIPGKASNAVTMLDGYPMTCQGRAKTAIGCAAASSALGSTIGIGVLIAMLPLMREAVVALGPAEYLMLAIWGLTTLAALTGDSLVKGLIAACVGLQLAFIGHDPRSAEPRFTFGIDYLEYGLSLVPVLLGLFALAEVVDLMVSGRETLSGQRRLRDLTGSVFEGVRAVFSNFGLLVRSSIIGVVVGAIPGIGGSVAGFVAYGHASQTARDRSRFGHGDIRGVLAPEAAADAKDGGALVPTLALGIPGGTGTAMLLGVLTLHGLSPGRELLTNDLVLVFVLIWSLFLSNWATSLLGLSLVNPMARLSTIRVSRLVPAILALAMIGATQYRGMIEDAICAIVFGFIGFLMKRNHWPRVPLVIAMSLALLFETNLHLTLRLQDLGRIDFWSRPMVLVLLGLAALNLFLPSLLPQLRKLRSPRSVPPT
jgi:putative tricarboxylic transport membrane protein